MPFYKDPPIIDRELMVFMKLLIRECEWPNCHSTRVDAAHIKARGMGGGYRKDTPENLVIACRDTHHLTFTREQQAWVRENIIAKRPDWVVREIESYLRTRKFSDL